jgi:hypothetical protein
MGMNLSKAFFTSLCVCTPVLAQNTAIQNKDWCAKIAEANLKETKEKQPEVAAMILTYTYEYSSERHACVAIMEYSIQKNGKLYAQILARNMVTLRPMKGFDEIYMEPMENVQARIDDITYLLKEYSK